MKAFVGLIEHDTVLGLCITTIISKNYSMAGINSNFLIDKLRINFYDDTYSLLKPLQIEESVINEGKSTYYQKQYFFKVDNLKKFDRAIKTFKIINEKDDISEEIYSATLPNFGIEDISYFVRAYLIPIQISKLEILPQVICSQKIQERDIDIAFAKVFMKTRNAFCSITDNCKCE